MESIAVEEKAKMKDVIDLSGDVSGRVLGMKWYVGDDCFAYFVLEARLAFRSVCLGGLGWCHRLCSGILKDQLS